MQKLQLSIPEPCHENWQQMTPTDQGRFCNACAKEVVDFSMMTDMQVLNYFSTLTHEKVCGRALPEQLNRTISRPITPKKRLFWYWNYIVMFFMFFGKGNAAKAQGGIKPVTECSPVKTNDIRGEIAAMGKVKSENNRIISGKVTDKDGNPVSFASVKVKGANTGISADANGAYSMRVKSGDILFIAAGSFKSIEVPVGSEEVINTVLEQFPGYESKEIVISNILGTFSYRNVDTDYSTPDKVKAVAILKVKDEETGKFLSKASVIINSNSSIDTVFTDTKGIYKIKGVKKYNNYYIKVTADGYESNEFTIDEADFQNRKKEWEVLLRKQKPFPAFPNRRISTGKNLGQDVTHWVGKITVVPENKDSLYIIDGKYSSKKAVDNLTPDDIDTYEVLKGPQAMAIFGSEGSNSAIIITTRKSKEKNLKEVVVSSTFGIIRRCRNGTSCLNVTSLVKDTIKAFMPNSNGSFKIYPNPVQRGNTFNLSLKLKQTGLYQIQITDAVGRTVLQKQIHAVSKEFTERVVADYRWSNGLYYISLMDNKNQLVNKSSFIMQ